MDVYHLPVLPRLECEEPDRTLPHSTVDTVAAPERELPACDAAESTSRGLSNLESGNTCPIPPERAQRGLSNFGLPHKSFAESARVMLSSRSNCEALNVLLSSTNDIDPSVEAFRKWRAREASREWRARDRERRRKIRDRDNQAMMQGASYLFRFSLDPEYFFQAIPDPRSKMTLARERNIESSSHWTHPSSHTVIPLTMSPPWPQKVNEQAKRGLQPALVVRSPAIVSARRFPSTSALEYFPLANLAYTPDSLQTCGKGPWSSMGRPPSMLLMSFFITGAFAQNHDPATDSDWRQRAIASLTNAIVQYAFLVPPMIILGLGGIVAWKLMKRRAEYALAGFMLLMAILYGTIHVDPTEGATGSDRSVRTAVGILYLVFMWVYCRSVILSHGKDKGTSAIATLLGLTIGCGCMILTPIRDFMKSLGHSPACVIPLTLPLGFVICDVILHIAEADHKRNGGGNDHPAHHERFGTRRWDELHGTSSQNLRWRFGLSSPSGYDICDEEYNLGGHGDGNAAPTSTLQPPTPTSSSWFFRLFSKAKAA